MARLHNSTFCQNEKKIGIASQTLSPAKREKKIITFRLNNFFDQQKYHIHNYSPCSLSAD